MIELPNETIDLPPAHDMPRDVPVMGVEPVKAKKKRKRKKAAKPRASKKKLTDPIIEASKASTSIPPELQSAQPVGEAPASSIVHGVGAARFDEVAPTQIYNQVREPDPVRLSTTLTALLVLAAVGASAGVYMAWF